MSTSTAMYVNTYQEKQLHDRFKSIKQLHKNIALLFKSFQIKMS